MRILISASLLLGSSMALASPEPNINPGLWEFTTTMSFQSAAFSVPDQRETNRECLTAEDLADGATFIEEMEGCEIVSQDLRSDGMTYSMSCQAPDGSQMTMNADMSFDGDQSSGTITGEMDSPMGQMTIVIQMQGQRVEDC